MSLLSHTVLEITLSLLADGGLQRYSRVEGIDRDRDLSGTVVTLSTSANTIQTKGAIGFSDFYSAISGVTVYSPSMWSGSLCRDVSKPLFNELERKQFTLIESCNVSGC